MKKLNLMVVLVFYPYFVQAEAKRRAITFKIFNMADEDLEPSKTDGYKVAEKKTILELANMDSQDESLRKWKESLGIGVAKTLGPSDDPRKVIVLALGLEVEGKQDIMIDLSTPGRVTLRRRNF